MYIRFKFHDEQISNEFDYFLKKITRAKELISELDSIMLKLKDLPFDVEMVRPPSVGNENGQQNTTDC